MTERCSHKKIHYSRKLRGRGPEKFSYCPVCHTHSKGGEGIKWNQS